MALSDRQIGGLYLMVTAVLGKDAFDHYNEQGDQGFATRVKVIKTAYILSELASSLKTHWSWYMTGPYCPEVGRAIEEVLVPNLDLFKKDPGMSLNERGLAIVEKVRDYFDIDTPEVRPQGLKEHEWFYVMGALHYLNTHYHIDLLAGRLNELTKGWISQKAIEEAALLYKERASRIFPMKDGKIIPRHKIDRHERLKKDGLFVPPALRNCPDCEGHPQMFLVRPKQVDDILRLNEEGFAVHEMTPREVGPIGKPYLECPNCQKRVELS